MEETVALRVLDVEVALVADEGVGDAIMAVEKGKVEGDVAFIVTLI